MSGYLLRALLCFILFSTSAFAEEKKKEDDMGSVYLSWLDRTVVAAAGTLISISIGMALKWAKPQVEMWTASMKQSAQAHVDVAIALKKNADSLEGLESAWQVISRFVVALQASTARNKHLLLLVEDSPTQVVMIRAMCTDLIRKYHMEFIDVTTLEDSFQHLPEARVVVLDVTLPDNRDDLDGRARLNRLIQLVNCPVIIYSETQWIEQDFPGAAYILRKGAPAPEIRRTIENAITGVYK